MTMKTNVSATLMADAGVSALVARRVYWGRRPQGSTLPAIVMFLITGGDTYTMSGPDALGDSLIQINCLGSSYTAADALSTAVKTALSGLRNSKFSAVFLEGERDTDDGENPDSIFQISLDARVWAST